MKIITFARWAALGALMLAPLAASADKDYDKDKDRSADEATKDKDKDKTSDEAMPKKGAKMKEAKLNDSELQVIAHVHHVNQMEIDAGKMAQKQGSTQAIKSYGEMLVKDHQQNDRDLTSFAKKHGQAIPMEKATNEADKKDMQDTKDAMNKLGKMKGADFDREFLRMMVDGHDKELAKIDSEAAEVTNNDLQTMLKDMKPVLQRHADQARELMKNNAQAQNP
jgi:putative membrane protein